MLCGCTQHASLVPRRPYARSQAPDLRCGLVVAPFLVCSGRACARAVRLLGIPCRRSCQWRLLCLPPRTSPSPSRNVFRQHFASSLALCCAFALAFNILYTPFYSLDGRAQAHTKTPFSF
eukprot:scaffold189872_cov27-Tisochrysis_lutea.AAC.3